MANTAARSVRDTRTSRIGMAGMLLGALLAVAGLVQTTSSHNTGDNQSCPSGSVLVAKFNYVHGYVFEKPAGNQHVVTLTGASASGATWHSTLGVSAVIVKGGTASVVTSIAPPQYDGHFSNAGLPKVGHENNTPDISNVQFCGPSSQPTTTASSTTCRCTTTSTSTPPSSTSTSTSEPATSSTATSTTASTSTSTSTSVPPTTGESGSTSSTARSTTSTTVTSTTVAASTTNATSSSTSSSTTEAPTTTNANALPETTATQVAGSTAVDSSTTTEGDQQTGTNGSVVTSTSVFTPTTGTELPFTGSQSAPLLILGILFLASGFALTMSSTRRRGSRA